ncbi:MAG: hypothetical protein WA944_12850 [Mycobacterium sp.]
MSALLFGGMWNAPIPDLDRTDHLMMLGANPSASQGSMLSAPDIMGRLAAIRERGGTVVVVDPRRTQTARRARSPGSVPGQLPGRRDRHTG